MAIALVSPGLEPLLSGQDAFGYPSSSSPCRWSLLVSSAAGYGPRISAGPSGATPSPWTCSAGPQNGLSPSQTRKPSLPDRSLPFPSPPLPRTGGFALHHTGAVPSWSSGSPVSPRLIPRRTPSSVAPELVRLPGKPLVSPRLSHRRFGIAQPALSRVPGRAEPLTRTPLSLQLSSTSPKKRSDKKPVIDPPSGQGSIQSKERSAPHSSLEAYNKVLSNRPGSASAWFF